MRKGKGTKSEGDRQIDDHLPRGKILGKNGSISLNKEEARSERRKKHPFGRERLGVRLKGGAIIN